jgi:hypothetical protein
MPGDAADYSEYKNGRRATGLVYPAGSILYVLLGRFFIILFFFLPKIKTVTLVSIISVSATSVFFYYRMIELLNNVSKSS